MEDFYTQSIARIDQLKIPKKIKGHIKADFKTLFEKTKENLEPFDCLRKASEENALAMMKMELARALMEVQLKGNARIEKKKLKKLAQETTDWFKKYQTNLFADELDDLRKQPSFQGTKDEINTIMKAMSVGLNKAIFDEFDT